jgi:hypothetical protein
MSLTHKHPWGAERVQRMDGASVLNWCRPDNYAKRQIVLNERARFGRDEVILLVLVVFDRSEKGIQKSNVTDFVAPTASDFPKNERRLIPFLENVPVAPALWDWGFGL